MQNTISLSFSNVKVRTILFDLTALALITFLPAASHLLSFPLYLLEPMRILLILSIVHTTKKNTYLIAAALPLLSFILSSHPVFFKTVLVLSEFTLNVWLFFYLSSKIKNSFGAMISSILISKVCYYAVKFLLMKASLIDGDFVATPIYIQVIVALVLSVYVYFIFGRHENKSN